MQITDEQRLTWGPELREKLKLIVDLHPIVEERAHKQEKLDASLREALHRADSNESMEALSRAAEAIKDAARRARLIAVKLETQYLEGSISGEAYHSVMSAAFPSGTQQFGETAVTRLDILRHVVAALVRHREVDPDGALRFIAEEGAQRLAELTADVGRNPEMRQQAHGALVKVARSEWDAGYTATKEIISGVLRDAGRRGELAKIFPDVKAQRRG
jgi:hypothetical protein